MRAAPFEHAFGQYLLQRLPLFTDLYRDVGVVGREHPNDPTRFILVQAEVAKRIVRTRVENRFRCAIDFDGDVVFHWAVS